VPAADCNGVIRLLNALTRVEEMLSRYVGGSNNMSTEDEVMAAGSH
jgi:hypothetical protein